MTTATSTDALVTQIIEGRAPLRMRAAAARGALPLPRAALARLYLHLRRDDEEEVRLAAKHSLSTMDTAAVVESVSDPDCAPEVLTFFAKQAARKEALAERIAFHPAAPPAALAVLAGGGNAAVIELVLTNQEQLLKVPGLLDSLMVNPALRVDQRGRILELLGRVARQSEEAKQQRMEAGDEDEEDDDPFPDLEATAQLLEVDVGQLLSASEIIDAEEFEHAEDVVIRNAFQRIVRLNGAQKAVLALKGGREERLILIRDSNKVVALGVLKNPRITEPEVESIANMRNVTDDVLRQIGINRDWSKQYSIIVGLVQNPRTPPSVSTNFISRLNPRDLKALVRSRDVPELVRRMAKRTIDLRAQRQGANFKKK